MLRRGSVIGVVVLVLALLLGACVRRDYKLLSKRKMVSVMTEMYLTDGAFDAMYMRNQQEKLAYYNDLFAKYGISRDDFEKSAAYYSRDPKVMEGIYEQVIANLKVVEGDVTGYRYHPTYLEDVRREELLRRLDSLDVWPKMQRRFVWNRDSVGDMERFSFDVRDSSFFASGDRFALSFAMRVGKQDSLRAGVQMCVQYLDKSIDTVRVDVERDSLLRHYRLCVNNVDSQRVVAVYGRLIDCDSVDARVDRCIDSVKLARIYDAKSHPLNDSIRALIKSKNSAKKESQKSKSEQKTSEKKSSTKATRTQLSTNRVMPLKVK